MASLLIAFFQVGSTHASGLLGKIYDDGKDDGYADYIFDTPLILDNSNFKFCQKVVKKDLFAVSEKEWDGNTYVFSNGHHYDINDLKLSLEDNLDGTSDFYLRYHTNTYDLDTQETFTINGAVYFDDKVVSKTIHTIKGDLPLEIGRFSKIWYDTKDSDGTDDHVLVNSFNTKQFTDDYGMSPLEAFYLAI